MEAKFKFYEVVQIAPEHTNQRIAGAEGAILGIAQDAQGAWFYSVYLYTFDKTWSVEEQVLKSTGRTDKRESFYDKTVLRISVDPVTHKGTIIENKP